MTLLNEQRDEDVYAIANSLSSQNCLENEIKLSPVVGKQRQIQVNYLGELDQMYETIWASSFPYRPAIVYKSISVWMRLKGQFSASKLLGLSGGEGGLKTKNSPSILCPLHPRVWTWASCKQHHKVTRSKPEKIKRTKQKFSVFLYSFSHRIAVNFFLNKLKSPINLRTCQLLETGQKSATNGRDLKNCQPKAWLNVLTCATHANNDTSSNAKLVSLLHVCPMSS